MTSNNTSASRTPRKSGIFYGYIIVATGFFIMMLVHGTVNTFGVFFNPLLDYFGSSRAALSLFSTLSFFTMGTSAILMGVLSDRFGPRIVLTTATSLFGIGYLLLSRTTALWQLYLVAIIIGIGFSPSDVVPLSTVVRWFVRKRGMMSGIMKVGTGLGMTVVPLIAGILISKFDWRNSYMILGIMILVIVVPLTQLMKRDPREIGELPDGERHPDTDNPVTVVEPGLRLHEAIRTRQLWLVCGFYTAIMYVSQSILVHIVPHAVDMNVPETVAASLVSTIGGSSIFGRLFMGFTGDRIGHKRAVNAIFLTIAVSYSWLLFSKELWMLYVFAAVYGFSHGGFFALISPLIAGLFGTRSQGTLLGIAIFCGTLFGSISPVITGRIFDVTHSYHTAFLILLFVAIAGLIFTILLKPIGREVEK